MNEKRSSTLGAVVAAAFVAAAVAFLVSYTRVEPAVPGPQNAMQSTFSSVNQSGILKCGYIAYPPAIYKDEAGEVVGIFADAVNEAASRLEWRVEWIEGNWPDLLTNLNSSRWDAFCGAAWMNSVRVRAADFGDPLYYSFLSVYGNTSLADLGSYEVLNSDEFTVAVLDGDTSMAVAAEEFPDAERLSLTELNSYSDIFDNIASGRADFTIAESSFVRQYNQNIGEEQLVQVGSQPIRVFANGMMYRKDAVDLRRAIDGILSGMLNEGYIDGLIEHYANGDVLPVAFPYREYDDLAQ